MKNLLKIGLVAVAGWIACKVLRKNNTASSRDILYRKFTIEDINALIDRGNQLFLDGYTLIIGNDEYGYTSKEITKEAHDYFSEILPKWDNRVPYEQFLV